MLKALVIADEVVVVVVVVVEVVEVVISNYNDDNHPWLCLFLICLLCWFLAVGASPDQSWLVR